LDNAILLVASDRHWHPKFERLNWWFSSAMLLSRHLQKRGCQPPANIFRFLVLRNELWKNRASSGWRYRWRLPNRPASLLAPVGL
jgi:hypothetical protein